ncbi:glycosyl transferase [Mactra antiquata]
MIGFWSMAVGISLFKLLLLPSYKSTDFDVHRNWLAITHSLPVRKWYFESTSEWTLDYPPFFAWFECLLSQFAVLFDPEMLKVENVDYRSYATILFQQLSVIVTDLVYVYGVKEFCALFVSKTRKSSEKEDILQSPVIYQGRNMSAAFWFATLLNFKHIYLYIAPAYFVYLLRCYVFQSNEEGRIKWRSFSILRLIGLGIIVIAVFTLSLGPFIILNQIPQLLSRLFPFKRGLCHAYWAPNFWAMYNIVDKGLSVTGTRLKLFSVKNITTATMTGGLVQEFDHSVLPSISPIITLILSTVSMLPSLFILWSQPKGVQSFVRALILCAFGSFMFGWHVHEKAILMIIIPLSLLAIDEKKDAQIFLFMSTIGHYSLFPLLYTQFESPIKICLLVLTTLFNFTSLANVHREAWSYTSLPLLSTIESIYLLGVIPLELYSSIGHYILGLNHTLPFLPLLLTSVYCSIGVIYCWIKFYMLSYSDKPKYGKQH